MKELKVGTRVLADHLVFFVNPGTEMEIIGKDEDQSYTALVLEGEMRGGKQHFPSYGWQKYVKLLSVDVPEESLDLTLQSATFVTKAGVKVAIKRSPCRHYYVKFEGQVQDRVSLAEVKKLMEGLK